MKRIDLTQGQAAIVDDADYDDLMCYNWAALWSPGTQSFYAARSVCFPKNIKQHESMHRRILGLAHGDKRQGDHINHDTLDNRRGNLRIVSVRENAENRRNSAPYGTGIQLIPNLRTKPFKARMQVADKVHYLGYFRTAAEAVAARAVAVSALKKSQRS